MTPILENAAMESDLDCQNLDIRNIAHFHPVPDGLVDKDDPGLYDPRVPPFLSVTDDSVSPTAGITQGKLSLDGVIPGAWLGSSKDQAAPGDLAERLSQKGANSGYAALDATGKLLPANVTAGAGLGTVSHVVLQMPPELNVAGNPIETSGVFTATWKDVPHGSWFGVHAVGLDGVLAPSFMVEPFPPGLIPGLDAAKFTTGIFPAEMFPIAVGVNDGGAPGLVPDPGELGEPTDYLGRDMLYHTFQADAAYQPRCPKPTIRYDSVDDDGNVFVTVRSTLTGSALFIRVNTGDWVLGQDGSISVLTGDTVWAYAAKAGYNNSDLASWKVVTPLTTIP